MWSFTKPTEQAIREILARQTASSLTYSEVGASDQSPVGYDVDHHRVELGIGADTFNAACAAIRGWKMFPAAWSEIYPYDTPIETDRVVVILFRVFGLWWTSAARIVYVMDETTPIRRFGFAYGTLPEHIECGEERFTVECDAEGRVWYDLRSFSRPGIGYFG